MSTRVYQVRLVVTVVDDGTELIPGYGAAAVNAVTAGLRRLPGVLTVRTEDAEARRIAG
jgi:hypothetical protein